MKKHMMTAVLAAAMVGLSGCNKQAETPSAEARTAEAASGAISGMAMAADAKMGKASGIVTAIDAASGKITLDHGAIPAVSWPAMKMGFSAKPELLKGVAVGDKVDFDVTVTESGGQVTAIKKK